jgi:hypothetical protein
LLNATISLESLLQQNGINGWINVFLDVLYQNGSAIPDCSRYLSQEIVLTEPHKHDIAVLFDVFYPLVGLLLRIDAKRPPLSLV